MVQAESYFLACSRYIELNPVRAGMVADPGQYSWSSYRANGLGRINPRLTPHSLYLQLGMPVGNERFAEAVCAQLGVRYNSGKRGRRPGAVEEKGALPASTLGQTDFGF